MANETKGLDISLIAENRAIVPGSTIYVGLKIHHHPGFHTYWKSPGVVGMATAMEWQLPPGFTAGVIQWPYPELTTMAGHPCHGYERDVTLIVPITAPKKINTNSVTLSAKTRWMCCAKNCHPGFKDFSLTLPVAKKTTPNPSSAKHFLTSRAELPKKNAPWITTLLSKPDAAEVIIRFKPKEPVSPAPLYLFSEDGQISSNKKQTFAKQPDGSLLLTIARSEFSPKEKNKLPAVIKTQKNHYSISPSYSKPSTKAP
ncbi:MAG: protein-disulfide reductase DsbD domain-containing protein [Akkermansiaceae bacterium]